jgi:hypothetical protein
MTAPRRPAPKAPRDATRTLTDLLFHLDDPTKRAELNAFRMKYEACNQLTDLTKHYTSQWPTPRQQWLFENDQQRWFDGLPDFAREFFKQKIEQEWSKPQPYDRLPSHFISEYLGGRVSAPEETIRGRGRG